MVRLLKSPKREGWLEQLAKKNKSYKHNKLAVLQKVQNGTAPTMYSPEELKVLSTVISRASTARHWGKSYDTKRDILSILGYPDKITWEDCVASYRRQDIAKAVINRPIQATWRDTFTVQDAGPEDTEFEKAWDLMAHTLNIKSFL